jgi:hypothetical protein
MDTMTLQVFLSKTADFPLPLCLGTLENQHGTVPVFRTYHSVLDSSVSTR